MYNCKLNEIKTHPKRLESVACVMTAASLKFPA